MNVLQSIINLSDEERIKLFNSMSENEALNILYNWSVWGRDKQQEPLGDWRTWLVLAGRGFGKTRTGAETIRKYIESNKFGRIALVGATAADVRDVMVEGESGIINISPPWFKPIYEPSKRRITWPNGAIATLFSAEEPDRLRGPQVAAAWCDEICAWRYDEDTWDNLMFGLRLGNNPKCIVTSTPKPTKLLKEIIRSTTTALTKGTTYENKSNLAKSFFTEIISKYEGTRIGRQELMAELLEDTVGALWNRKILDDGRVKVAPELKRIIVSVDPAATSKKSSNETGIIVLGLAANQEGYILDDLSVRGTPEEWAKISVEAYNKYRADRIIAESNQGGEMVSYTIKTIDDKVPVKLIHASRGKYTRAEPVSSLYSQNKVHHVGSLGVLEDQLCTWVQGEESPDRLDALVHGVTELMLNQRPTVGVKTLPNLSQTNIWQ